MKRILYLSLVLLAFCSPNLAQDGRQISAQRFASVAEVTSIPLSDTLVEKANNPDENRKRSGRESASPDGASPADGQQNRYWVNTEYLLWRTTGSDLPPLLQRYSGFNDNSGEILIGGREVNPGNSSGGRITAGLWLNRSRTVGLEASYFYLGPRSINQSGGGNGDGTLNPTVDFSSIIIRPYNSAIFTRPLFLISYPFYARGNVAVSLASHLQGAELNSVYDLGRRGCCGVRLIGGFRFLDLKERLTILDNHVHNNITTLGDESDKFYQVTDEFATRNRFYGGQGGVQTEFGRGKLRVELSGKVALGGVRQLVNIGGSTVVMFRNTVDTRVGGLLALDTNIGRYERTRFAILPEAKASIGYQFTDNLAAFAGYDFLYLNRVARTAEQIDFTINWVHVPFLYLVETPVTRGGPARPAFGFSDSPFWAQGLTVGLRASF
jgi:hypothetical protein